MLRLSTLLAQATSRSRGQLLQQLAETGGVSSQPRRNKLSTRLGIVEVGGHLPSLLSVEARSSLPIARISSIHASGIIWYSQVSRRHSYDEGPRPKAVETRPIRTLLNLPPDRIRGWVLPPTVAEGYKNALQGAAWVIDSIKQFVEEVQVWRQLRDKPMDSLSYPERMALHRTQEDIWRLGPFLLYNMIPFSGMFLPVVVRLYPALLPSSFASAEGVLDELEARTKAQLECAKAFYSVTLDRVVEMESKWMHAGRPPLVEKSPLDLDDAVEEEMVKSLWWRVKLSGRNPALLWDKYRNDPQGLARELKGAMRNQVTRVGDIQALAKAAAKVSRSFVAQIESVREPEFWQLLWGKHGLAAGKTDAELLAELSWNPKSLRKGLLKKKRPDVVSVEQLMQWCNEYESAFRFEALTDMELSLMTGFLGVAPVSPLASRYTLVRRLQDRMEYLIDADAWLVEHGMNKLTDAELRQACVARGIFIMSPTRKVWYHRTRLEKALGQWLHVTVEEKAPVHWLLAWRLLHVASHLTKYGPKPLTPLS